MSKFYQKTALTIGLGSAIALSSFLLPHAAHAEQMEQFNLNATLTGSTITGTFDLDIDSRTVSETGTIKYDLINWDLEFTTTSGETTLISPGETGDHATFQLFPGYDFLAGFDRVNLTFIENNDNPLTSSIEELNLQIEFNTDYNITTNTTLTELLTEDSTIGTSETFRSGFIRLTQTGAFEYIRSGTLTHLDPPSETVSPVPEPSTLAMLGLGSLMMFAATRRTKKKQLKTITKVC